MSDSSILSCPDLSNNNSLRRAQLWTFLIMTHIMICLLTFSQSHAESRYVTLLNANQNLLKEFNDNLHLGRNYVFNNTKKNIVTVEDEVLAKVEYVVEKVEMVLNMFPDNLQFNLVILPTSQDVAAVYKKRYGVNVNYIAYYSLPETTIYISVSDANYKVLAHEIGHMVVDHYFRVRPPYNIHELMAQFAEKHVAE